MMNQKIISFFLSFCLLCASAFAHDLFLKLDSFFVEPNQKISITILNGSFQSSEGAVNASRLNDVSLVSPEGAISHPGAEDFTKDEKTSYLNLQPKEEGTYVVGLSTQRREIFLKAADFNEYLREDGIPDILAARERLKILDKNATERYSKHVKAIFQVGGKKTNSYKTSLNYPVEIIPQVNPYNLKIGDTFEFLCLKDGKPLANQYVMSGREFNTNHMIGADVRSDRKGIAKIKIDGAGKWYVKFIQMSEMKTEGLDYESKWTTLTFEVK
jgi:uncharacterized GH25 family protein